MQTPKVKVVWTGPNKRLPGRGNVVRGQELEISRRDLKTFKAVGWATDAPAQVEEKAMTPAAQTQTQQPPADPALDALRGEYQQVVGRRAYHGWGSEQLREKIEQARGTYSRRDMRAED